MAYSSKVSCQRHFSAFFGKPSHQESQILIPMHPSVSRRIRGTSGFNQSRNSFAPGRGFKSLTTSIMSLGINTKRFPSYNKLELVLEPLWGRHNSIMSCHLFIQTFKNQDVYKVNLNLAQAALSLMLFSRNKSIRYLISLS